MESAPVMLASYREKSARPWGLLTAAVVSLGLASWWMYRAPTRELQSAERLLAEAYAGQRTSELRLPGEYAPMRAQPIGGAATFSRPIALLDAESRIARGLAANPEDPEWLRLRARADMLEGDYEDAVSVMRRAVDSRPDDASLIADLGVAYAMRAEGEHREIDYGAAIDTLWRVLRARPDFALAVFNRAVVYERMFLFDDARKDWERYLQLDSNGGWADEARGRKQAIERRMEARDQATKSLASASGYLQAVKEGRAWDPEFYLDHAVMDWLPAADATSHEALGTLARSLKEKHGDSWLEDLLKAKVNREANAHLAAAAKHNLADEAEAALEEARVAERGYREAGSRAGQLRARYEESYALFRALQGKQCFAVAGKLADETAGSHYGWLHAQALMESGNCRGITGDHGGGRIDFEHALSVAHRSDYQTLELRVLGLLGANATNVGNQLAVWKKVTDRLARYWDAPYRRNRGHQFYYDLSNASSALGYNFSAFVFRRAAAEEISGIHSLLLEAHAHAIAANLADSANMPVEASREIDKARQLFAQCPQTVSIQRARFGVEIRRAELEVRTNPRMALTEIENIVPRDTRFPTADLERLSYQAEGRARLALGDLSGADVAFRRVIESNEKELASLAAGADRYGPLHKSEDAYRGTVYISLARSPDDALRQWEWYRSGDLSGPRRGQGEAAPWPQSASDIVLSYVLLPDGSFNVWAVGDGRVESRRLAVKRDQLEPVASRFLRQCADPKSSLSAVRRDGRQLYDWLIAPVEYRLKRGRVVVIEPDGPITVLPWQALINPDGNYLGGTFPMVISKGLEAYRERGELQPVNSRSAALMIANPVLGNELARVFPPLEDAAREAQDVASLFAGAKFIRGQEATLEALESARQGINVFHFAGHSVTNGGDAGLLLAPSRAETGGRLLDSSTLQGQDWSRCSLVVLSACSTGTGERSGFANPESLVRAFLNAGAGRVIASRWNVDTAATAGFMRHFYQSVLSGALPSVALREAAETLRKNPATAHPYYWAAFQLFGYK
jgi:CHAT domain-containing protein